jgi:hypothetical protein
LEVPVTRVEKVKSSKLEPGPSVIRGGRQVSAEKTNSHAALPRPLEGGGARRDVRIYGRLAMQSTAKDYRGNGERGRTAVRRA